MTEDELGETGLPPPFWAFAWAGGQALARYVLDAPELVRGKRVLDLGAGGGIAGIAAALCGAASVRAAEIDPFARTAISLNAALNGVSLAPVGEDLLDGPADADVVLAGDIFYEKPLATRAYGFLVRADEAGALVLIGDPKRSYLPADRLTIAATYTIPGNAALEDQDVKRTSVWRLAERW
ncbi:methyltransferase [Acuticoccus sp. 2012]|uniref:Methyltransferase n=2 Tax=Acuticoccus mangrovi TaxID=2796142 RepID=A0A934IU67_9HYPH|nr:methyltransferase [Acuticoccus mangrovi]